MNGDQGQAQIDRGVPAAHGGGHAGEGTGQQVDDQHGQHVLIGRALGENAEPLVDGALGHGECHQHGDEHGGYGGELIKGHFHALTLKDDAGAQVNYHKYQERDQRGASAFLVQGVIHNFSPLRFCFPVNTPSFRLVA